MPLPRAEREVELLTEGWPDELENLELAAFAATFRSDRPELSAPALDRIGRRVEGELHRQERSAGRKQVTRATVMRFRRLAPLTAAAILILALGTWLHFRPVSPAADGIAPVQGVPIIRSRPAPTPDGPPAPAASKPIVN